MNDKRLGIQTIPNSNNARIQFFKCWRFELRVASCELRVLLTCLTFEFNPKSCYCCCVLWSDTNNPLLKVYLNEIRSLAKRNGTCYSNIQNSNDSLCFFDIKFKLKICITKPNYSVVIVSQFNCQLSEWLDKTALALLKFPTTGCWMCKFNWSQLHSEFIVNNGNFICPIKQ